jgi:uncharacterized membrane protein
MTKQEFLEILERRLSRLSEAERQEVIADHVEHFDIGLKAGKTEQEIAKSLGDPRRIAATYLTEVYAKRLSEARSPGSFVVNIAYLILAALGLGFFNLVFFLGPYMAALAMLFLLWLVPFAALAASCGLIYALFTMSAAGSFFTLTNLGIGLLAVSFAAMGAAMVMATCFISYWFAKATFKYITLNFKILAQGVKE